MTTSDQLRRLPATAATVPPRPDRRKLLGLALCLISATGFGFLGPGARIAYDAGANVQTLGTLRFAGAAALLWLWAAWRGRIQPLSLRQLGQLALLGGVGYSLQSALYFTSVRFITPDLAALLLYTFPALVVLLSALIYRERLTLLKSTVVLLCVGGAALTAGGGGAIHPLVIAAALGAALVYAVYIIYSRVVLSTVEPLLATCWVVTFAALAYALTTLSTGAFTATLAPGGWLAIGVVVLFSTVLAILFFFLGVVQIGPAGAALASSFEPVATVGLTILLFGVQPSGWQWLGMALVLGGVALQAVPAADQERAE
jgi:drug/metabolite transporter (DMT)-like permease